MRSNGPSPLLVLGVAAIALLALGHRAEIRARAESALGRGMPAREAELARGFVLGEDERIDAETVEDFRRSGLSHLLAVSGQNVALLALLAMPLLAALGMPLRVRLVWILAAIAVYVPLAGAEPSIVRAGVMGGLSVLATLAGRRTSRLYALVVAAAVTLAVDPGIGAEVGWQLSFAAVLGILAMATPLRRAIESRLGGRGLCRALAEGTAMTVAATLATAPLIAFHFEGLSTTALIANLLALPAVAPAMWLGMLSGLAGQVPGFPVAALNAIAAPLLAYIAQVAAWCGRPSWAYASVRLGPVGLITAYLVLAASAVVLPAFMRRRHLARLGGPQATPGCNAFGRKRTPYALHPRRLPAAIGAVALVAVAWTFWGVGDGGVSIRPRGLRISVLDVGQGDAILLQPAGGPAVLIDGGPCGEDLAAKLGSAGVDALGVAIVTHEQSDHSCGIEDVLDEIPIERLLHARLGRGLRGDADAAGVDRSQIAAGGSVRVGSLRLEALWPPPELLDRPLAGADPNTQALVLLARWWHFAMLLTADAEAGEVPLDPGPVDVLKVAHHGSEDPGLVTLLERVSPRLALISVGEGNPYGHPAPETVATLATHGVPTLRTDRAGTIVLDVDKNSFGVVGAD